MTSVRPFLLDTNVISETRKQASHPAVIAFFADAAPSSLYVSVLTFGELRRGVAKKAGTNPAMAIGYSIWIDSLEEAYSDRVFNVDRAIAAVWGKISADRTRPVVDTLLAATAMVHNLILVTRNTADFVGLPVDTFNPWNET